MIRRPPRSTRTDTLFPYTTLFRSLTAQRQLQFYTVCMKQFLLFSHWSLLIGRAQHVAFVLKHSTTEGRSALSHIAGTLGTRIALLSSTIRDATSVVTWRRSEERREGKDCVSTCRCRWSQYHKKQKKKIKPTYTIQK